MSKQIFVKIPKMKESQKQLIYIQSGCDRVAKHNVKTMIAKKNKTKASKILLSEIKHYHFQITVIKLFFE